MKQALVIIDVQPVFLYRSKFCMGSEN